MKFPKSIKIIAAVVLFLGLIAYVGYAFWGMKPTSPDEVCDEVVYLFDDDGEDMFIDSLAVAKMFEENGVTLKGQKMGNIDMREIEQMLLKNPFVTSVDCYGNNNGMKVGTGRVCVKIKQMVPVLLVFDNKLGRYYLDSQGNKIKTDSIYAKNMLVANGDISPAENKNKKQVAENPEPSDDCWKVWRERIDNVFNDVLIDNFITDELIPFAVYIRNDEFWNSQIEQIFVEYDKNKNRVVTLIPRVGDQRIFMGTLDNYEKKMSRLKKFYERGLSVVGWNKYSILNLEFENQVVGIIKGKEPKVLTNDSEATDMDLTQTDDSKKNDETKKEETKKEEVKKEEVKKEEPKKVETKKDEQKKAESKNEGPQKKEVKNDSQKKEEETKKDAPKKEEAKKDTPKKDETKKDTSKKEEPNKTDNKKEEPKKQEGKKDAPKKSEPQKDSPKKK